jgi:dTDP-glucose 4,6-dehydratase
MILVTGGCGFIGSNFILNWLQENDESIVNIDCMTYAGMGNNLSDIEDDSRYFFALGDIRDRAFLRDVLNKHKPRAVIHFAAESHVDRSIDSPQCFIDTNIVGTFNLLEEARNYWDSMGPQSKTDFRFIHISTDEVYGSLKSDELPFEEKNRYKPNSPYAASKASSDHIVRSYEKTYSFPAIISNCSNNYGPFQFPEKLIPLIIKKCLSLQEIPIYGDGLQIRDWLHVYDHCAAIELILQSGKPGEVYNIGGRNEQKNIEVVNTICDILDELAPNASISSYKVLISFVKDRLGHDQRYAINSEKISKELGWRPINTFEAGIRKTVVWYLDNSKWMDVIPHINKSTEN